MTLSSFTPEDAEILVSLPYKVGVWVSHADDEEGDADDERENKALESCIRAIAKLHEDKPLIAEIMAETLRRRAGWSAWYEGSFHVLHDIPKAVAAMRSKATSADFKNYRGALMEIAAAVARAYGEFGHFDEAQTEGFFSKIAKGFKSHDNADHPMNVSAAEDSALSRLAAALRDGEKG
jgi:hypothetical protein